MGKKGVVRDPAVHLEVLENFLIHAKESGFTVLDITFSPIRGPEGNIEYLVHLNSIKNVNIDINKTHVPNGQAEDPEKAKRIESIKIAFENALTFDKQLQYAKNTAFHC